MKQRVRLDYLILFLIFIFVLAFRLYFAFQTEHFNTDSAYFHYRHIQSIVEDKQPLSYDQLSYGGRYVLYPPLFHIIMALLSWGSVFLLKLLPEIIISMTVFVVYIIARDISGNSYAAVFSSLLSAFFPILFSETLNNISVYTFVIPLLLIMLYGLVRLDEKKYLWMFVVSSFLLPLVHPSALLYVVTVFLYFILLAGGALNPTKLKKEAVVFSTLLIVLFQFIIYKKAFLEYGTSVLWQNVPSNILSDSFRQLSFLGLVVGVGLLPLILGSIGIYICIIKQKKKPAYMFGAFALAILLLIVLRFLTLSVGLMYLGIVLSIFAASSIDLIYNYLKNFRFIHLSRFFIFLLVILFVISSFYPSFSAADESNEIAKSKIKEVRWFSFNTAPNAVVLGNVDEGNLIAVASNRTIVVDNNFLLAKDPIGRSSDVDIIYSTVSEAVATNLIKKYNISVVYISDETKDKYKIDRLNYAETSTCFDSVREGRYYVFKCQE